MVFDFLNFRYEIFKLKHQVSRIDYLSAVRGEI